MEVQYEPFEGDLTVEAAAVQAVYALDASAFHAEQQRDQRGLLDVGEAWLKLADFLAALRENDEKKPDKKKHDLPMGFTKAEAEINEDEVRHVIIEGDEIILEEEDEIDD